MVNEQGKYGIETLKAILEIIVDTRSIVEKLAQNKTQSKNVFQKIGNFFKKVFGYRKEFTALGVDIYFIATNAEQIKNEFKDLDKHETEELINFLFQTLGNKKPHDVLKAIPVLVDATQQLVKIYG